MPMSGIKSAWLLYGTATEVPSWALAILQYGLLACALIWPGRLAGEARWGKVTAPS